MASVRRIRSSGTWRWSWRSERGGSLRG